MRAPDIEIPAEFWKTVSSADFGAIVARGGLDAIQCATLWKIAGRTDACPASLQLLLKREDVERAFPRRRG